jgi:hypothetical protein
MIPHHQPVRATQRLVPIAPSPSVAVLMTRLKTQPFATTAHLRCVVKGRGVEMWLSLVFHWAGLLLLLVAKEEEVVVGAPLVLVPLVLVATFAPFKTGR